jgi:N-acetyl-anhydromuramyl-L-alanine amidase AmpD
LQSFSQTPGRVNDKPKPVWGDLPYHFYIDAAGRIGEGRDVNYAGDSNTRYNTADRLQIVLEGNFDKDQPTPEQLRALDQLVIWLATKYRVPSSKISGHNDHAPTDCPGRNLKSYLPQLRDKVTKASPPG